MYIGASGDLAASLLGASGFTINFATTTYLCYSTTTLVIISRITPPILDRTTTQVTHLKVSPDARLIYASPSGRVVHRASGISFY